MTSSMVIYGVALGLGIVAGLRTFTAPAATCWGASWGWLHLQGSRLAWMASPVAVWLFTLAALGELVMDKLPGTGSRTAAGPLTGRVISGGLCGAAAGIAGGQGVIVCVLLGAVGALIGTFGGHRARTGLVRALGVPDFVIALLEDAVAIAGGFWLASRL
jgi:uncharacterized membrane protein